MAGERRDGRRVPRGLVVLGAAGVLAVLLAIVAAAVAGVLVASLFAESARVEDRIRDDLAGEADEPGPLTADLAVGEHAVYAIDADGDMPRDPEVDLDVRVEAPDGSPVGVRRLQRPTVYQDPSGPAELALIGRFTVDEPGPHTVSGLARRGSPPIDRIGVGEEPDFSGLVPRGIGVIAAFMVCAGLMSAASGLLIGTGVWWISRPRPPRS